MADDKVICPFHNAGFSILTGEPENAPALDGLPVFEIIEKDGKAYVKVPYPLPKKKPMHMAKPDGSDPRKFVIIGGGAAGQSAAETLRQSDFKGEIIILSKEDRIPYDRTLLSKNTSGVDTTRAVLRSSDFLNEYGINYHLNSNVTSIDANSKQVFLENGTSIAYDKLLIASGGQAVKPRIPGIELQNVFTLRNSADQEAIKKVAPTAKKIVVLGSGFIGIETASHFKLAFKD